MFNENDVLRTTLVLTLLLSILSVIWRVQVALGLLLGGLISSLAFRLMIIDGIALLSRTTTEHISQKHAYRLTLVSFAKRYSLYALALIVGITSPYLSFFSTLAGLLLPRLAILYHLLYGRTKRGT